MHRKANRQAMGYTGRQNIFLTVHLLFPLHVKTKKKLLKMSENRNIIQGKKQQS